MTHRRFFPLDHQLALRADRWSGGAARVAARLGLEAVSFRKAAASFRDAVGAMISSDSVRRVTHSFGQQLEAQRVAVAQQVQALPVGVAAETVVAAVDPIAQQANVSSDGGMMRLRAAGWKEVKVSTFSAVHPTRVVAPAHPRRGRAPHEPLIELTDHSYQAGLWEADEMEQQQYVEGVRRRLTDVQPLSSVNDAAPWITRITQTNFPQAELIVDWHHAEERLQRVGEAAFAGDPCGKQQWLATQVDALWYGALPQVLAALDALDLDQASYPPEVRQAPGYFRRHHTRMAYPDYRAAGLPIGSGTVESAINTVVHHRLKRPGRGWTRDNAQGMLAALSSLHSQRFEADWHHVSALAA